MTITLEELDALQDRIRRAPADLIAKRIRRARREASIGGGVVRLSHDALAERMGTSSRHHLIKLEKGLHRPRAELLLVIAEATGYSVEWFLRPDPEDPFTVGGSA